MFRHHEQNMVALKRTTSLKETGGKPDNPDKTPKAKFGVLGKEMIEKEVKPSGNSGRVYLPSDWVGKHVKIIRIEELFARGIPDVMAEARDIVGNSPTYCSYDIDFIDPSYAPGTGTPEIGGPNSFQAQQVVRELSGVNLVGADLVEVSPPFDPAGGTAWLGVSIMFELMCVLATAIAHRRDG